jgi:S-adenosylmethionine-dependent methyltransferase
MEEDLGLVVRAWSGIRMLHDHIESNKRSIVPYDGLLAAERRWGQLEPYRSLARYIHMLGQKN